jgi:hypothetical protein
VVRDLKTSDDVEKWTMALLIRLTVQQAFLSQDQGSKMKTFQKMLEQIN